jgi:hypothetical protein
MPDGGIVVSLERTIAGLSNSQPDVGCFTNPGHDARRGRTDLSIVLINNRIQQVERICYLHRRASSSAMSEAIGNLLLDSCVHIRKSPRCRK